jgi:hypothetical protein
MYAAARRQGASKAALIGLLWGWWAVRTKLVRYQQ